MKDYNEAKTAELLLYIAAKTETDETAGSTKLNKISYFADRTHLRRHGETITGAEYQREPQGPVLRQMLPLVRKLEGSESVEEIRRPYYDREQKRLNPLREPDLSLFTEEELASVDEAIHELWGKSAKDVSDLSHHDAGWLAARETGEPINMNMAFIAEPELTDEIRERAAVLARQFA